MKLRSDELDRDDERIVSLHEKPQNTVLICEASDNDALSPLHAALLALGESERARFDNRSVSFSVKGLHMVDLSLVLQENAANVLRYSDNFTQTSRSQVADLIVLCDGVFPSASDREQLSERIASGECSLCLAAQIFFQLEVTRFGNGSLRFQESYSTKAFHSQQNKSRWCELVMNLSIPRISLRRF